jgi:hypothetical protein
MRSSSARMFHEREAGFVRELGERCAWSTAPDKEENGCKDTLVSILKLRVEGEDDPGSVVVARLYPSSLPLFHHGGGLLWRVIITVIVKACGVTDKNWEIWSRAKGLRDRASLLGTQRLTFPSPNFVLSALTVQPFLTDQRNVRGDSDFRAFFSFLNPDRSQPQLTRICIEHTNLDQLPSTARPSSGLSTFTMSAPNGTDAEKNIEIWKVKKLIKRLEAARGNGTSMISLIIRE